MDWNTFKLWLLLTIQIMTLLAVGVVYAFILMKLGNFIVMSI